MEDIMAPRFKTNMYQVYEGDECRTALICFGRREGVSVFAVRDVLAEKVSATDLLYVYRDQGHPTPLDSWFGFFTKKDEQAARKFLTREAPGLLARLVRSRKWKDYGSERERIMSLVRFELTTSHDHPCIEVSSSIHSIEELSELIEATAAELSIDMRRNPRLPPISGVLFTNRSFRL